MLTSSLPRVRVVVGLFLAGFAVVSDSGAGVLQQVNTGYFPGDGGADVVDSNSTFGLSSAEITSDIFASIGGTGPGNPGYFASAAAGRFGQI